MIHKTQFIVVFLIYSQLNKLNKITVDQFKKKVNSKNKRDSSKIYQATDLNNRDGSQLILNYFKQIIVNL